MKQPQKALLFAAGAIFFWSTVATAFKIALRIMSPYYLLLYSVFWSAAALFITLLIQGKARILIRMGYKEWLRSLGLGLINPVAYYLILFKSYDLLPAQITQPLNYTWPVVLVILSAPLLGQKMRMIDTLSLGLCFAGIILISQGGSHSGQGGYSPTGIFLALSSSLLWALYWILNQKKKGDREVQLFQSFLTAFPVLLILGILFPMGPPPICSSETFLSTAYVGLFEMGITFVLWSLAMEKSDRSADIGNLVYISPFLSLIWISLILQENVHITTLAGLVAIVLGILAGNLQKKSH